MEKGTWQPKRKKRMRKHGFLSRMFSSTGRDIIGRRRAKGRKRLSVKTGSK